MDENKIDSIMEKHIHRAFEQIQGEVETRMGVKPSEVANYLDKYWDLGDYYRDWWQTDDEAEWS